MLLLQARRFTLRETLATSARPSSLHGKWPSTSAVSTRIPLTSTDEKNSFYQPSKSYFVKSCGEEAIFVSSRATKEDGGGIDMFILPPFMHRVFVCSEEKRATGMAVSFGRQVACRERERNNWSVVECANALRGISLSPRKGKKKNITAVSERTSGLIRVSAPPPPRRCTKITKEKRDEASGNRRELWTHSERITRVPFLLLLLLFLSLFILF